VIVRGGRCEGSDYGMMGVHEPIERRGGMKSVREGGVRGFFTELTRREGTRIIGEGRRRRERGCKAGRLKGPLIVGFLHWGREGKKRGEERERGEDERGDYLAEKGKGEKQQNTNWPGPQETSKTNKAHTKLKGRHHHKRFCSLDLFPLQRWASF